MLGKREETGTGTDLSSIEENVVLNPNYYIKQYKTSLSGEGSIFEDTITANKTVNSYFAQTFIVPATLTGTVYVDKFGFTADSGSLTGLQLDVYNGSDITTPIIRTQTGITIDDLGTETELISLLPVSAGNTYTFKLSGLTTDKVIMKTILFSPKPEFATGMFLDSTTIKTSACTNCIFNFVTTTFSEHEIMNIYEEGAPFPFISINSEQSYGGVPTFDLLCFHAQAGVQIQGLDTNDDARLIINTKAENLKSEFYLSTNSDETSFTNFGAIFDRWIMDKTISDKMEYWKLWRLDTTEYPTDYRYFDTLTGKQTLNNKYSESFIFSNDDTGISSAASSYSSNYEIQNKTGTNNNINLRNLANSTSYDTNLMFTTSKTINDFEIKHDHSIYERALSIFGTTSGLSSTFHSRPVCSFKTFDSYSSFAQRTLINGLWNDIDGNYSYSRDSNLFIQMGNTAANTYQAAININQGASNNQHMALLTVNTKNDGSNWVSNQNRPAASITYDNNGNINIEQYSGSTSGTSLTNNVRFDNDGSMFLYNLSSSAAVGNLMYWDPSTKEITYDSCSIAFKDVIEQPDNEVNDALLNIGYNLANNGQIKRFTQKPIEPIYAPDFEMIEQIDENGEIYYTQTDKIIGDKIINQDAIDRKDTDTIFYNYIAEDVSSLTNGFTDILDEDGVVINYSDQRVLLLQGLVQKDLIRRVIELENENLTLNNNQALLESKVDKLITDNNLI